MLMRRPDSDRRLAHRDAVLLRAVVIGVVREYLTCPAASISAAKIGRRGGGLVTRSGPSRPRKCRRLRRHSFPFA